MSWYLEGRLPPGGDVELGLVDEAVALVDINPDVPPEIRAKVAQEAARLRAQEVPQIPSDGDLSLGVAAPQAKGSRFVAAAPPRAIQPRFRAEAWLGGAASRGRSPHGLSQVLPSAHRNLPLEDLLQLVHLDAEQGATHRSTRRLPCGGSSATSRRAHRGCGFAEVTTDLAQRDASETAI